MKNSHTYAKGDYFQKKFAYLAGSISIQQQHFIGVNWAIKKLEVDR